VTVKLLVLRIGVPIESVEPFLKGRLSILNSKEIIPNTLSRDMWKPKETSGAILTNSN
jgi:hypothetical protein